MNDLSHTGGGQEMWVKICANTSLADAQMAADLGADAVGFVFAPSARRVTPEEAGAITAGLVGGVERIGVFQTDKFEAIRDAVAVAGLSGVQLHGGYGRELARRIREEFGDGVTIAQTLHWRLDGAAEGGGTVVAGLMEQVKAIQGEGMVDRVLVDSKVGAALGGTGRTFNWEAAREVFGGSGVPMIVAGGLSAENVSKAIALLRPWGVDVASGVEAKPGRKDPERLRLFMGKARASATTTADFLLE